MNNRELENIIEEIKKGEGLKIIGIAKKAKVNRSYLSTMINSEEIKEVDAAYIGKLSNAFPTYFGNQQKTTDDKDRLDRILASLDELREYTVAILTGQSAGQEVIMGSLDRLEKNPAGSLSSAADKLALQLAERIKVIRKDKKAGAHK